MANLSDLGAASAGPDPSRSNRPNMLSVGDSLMWGQGLAPMNRFRERVRDRLSLEFAPTPIVEISMARSGAFLKAEDDSSKASNDHPQLLFEEKYSPKNFVREVPDPNPSTISQLKIIHKILSDSTDGSPEDIKWILLDGGINDIDVFELMFPSSHLESHRNFLSGWISWILKKCEALEKNMVQTLLTARENFPNATIIVNGYFPIFSLYSLAGFWKIQNLGLLYGAVGYLAGSFPVVSTVGFDAVVSGSAAWQAASNKHIRNAIKKVNKIHNNNNILFARSYIENEKCMYAVDNYLWEQDSVPFPDGLPKDIWQLIGLSAGFSPKDQVIKQRFKQCQIFTPEGTARIFCNIASIGHPNDAGSMDYAISITDEMENAELIPSHLNPCGLAERRRSRKCTNLSDEWLYECIRLEAKLGENCTEAVLSLAGKAKEFLGSAIDSLVDGASIFFDATDCIKDAAGTIANAAKNRLDAASKNLSKAAKNLTDAAKCWEQINKDYQKCDENVARRIGRCYDQYVNTSKHSCPKIKCKSFTNCNNYSKWNPWRYGCKAARRVCEGAALVRRAACKGAALVRRGLCRAAAEAAGIACRAGVTLRKVGCTALNAAKAAFNTLKGVLNSLLVIPLVLISAVDALNCVLEKVANGIGNSVLALGKALLAAVLGGVALVTQAACSLARWVFNRTCRVTNYATVVGCRTGAGMIFAACILADLVVRPVKKIIGKFTSNRKTI